MEDNKNYQEHCEEYYKTVAEKYERIRRREMFEKVALACLTNDFGKTIEYGNEWLNVVREKAEQVLEVADKFAKGE